MTSDDPRHDDGGATPDPEGAIDEVDASVLDALADVYRASDPMPDGLVERATFAVAYAELEAEVARLVDTATSERLATVRSRDPATARNITFAGESLTVTLLVSDRARGRRRLDGWVAGDAALDTLAVALRLVGDTVQIPVSADGRFSVEDLQAGMAQVSVVDGAGTVRLVTPTFQI